MKRVVMGILDTPQHADLTVRRLVSLGFSPRAVSVLYPDRHGDHDFGFESHSRAPEGALVGIGFGAILGSMTGLALGIAGWVEALAAVSHGPLFLAATGAVIGAVILGIVGAIVGASIPAIEAKYYDGKILVGSILVGIHVVSEAEARSARAALASVAASDITSSGEAALPVSS